MFARSLAAVSLCCYASLLHAQGASAPQPDPAAESPEYTTAKAAAVANWMNPPLMFKGVKDPVGVMTHDADELNAARALYYAAPAAVRGAVDGSMLQAAATVKVYGSGLLTRHSCELTPLAASVDVLTRSVSLLTDDSLCLGGQPAETLGHKIANEGHVRAVERQLTFGMLGRRDKAFDMNKATDPTSAAAIDFAVQQVVNNYSKKDIAAEVARERQSPAAQPQIVAPSIAPAKPAIPPLPPAHPVSTAVDIPSAASGYPPMHASNPANDGCWWAPFVSQKFGIEMAVSHCETDGWAVTASETGSGIALASPGSSSPPEQVITVETKPATQTLEAAIRQQFILKLKSPAARASCQAKCDAPKNGLASCSVVATGAYAKQKRFNRDDDSSDDPCPGLSTNDAIAYAFYARPSESKTKFLFYSADDLGAALDDGTIHFLPGK